MNKYFFISILVSVIISSLFSYAIFNGKIRFLTSGSSIPNLEENYKPGAPGEVLTARGLITEITGDEYVINTNEGVKITVHINSETTYATSFSPTQAEYETLYVVATSTPGSKPSVSKLRLKVSDRIEVAYHIGTTGKTEFIAKTIKLLR